MDLKNLIPENIKKELGGLTVAEELVLEKATRPEFADCNIIDGKKYDIENPNEWPDSRIVRAKLIESMLRNPDSSKYIHDRGFIIIGAKIIGKLDFAYLKTTSPLGISESLLEDGIKLYFACIHSFDFKGSMIGPVMAEGLITKGALFLEGAKFKRDFKLVGANINGDLVAGGAKFCANGNDAFKADRIIVKGTCSFKNASFFGKCNLNGAKILGDLNFNEAEFANEKTEALILDSANIGLNVFMNSINSLGEISLTGANIGQDIEIYKSEMDGLFSFCQSRISGSVSIVNTVAKNGNRVVIDGSLAVIGCNFVINLKKTEGEIRLIGITVNSDLEILKSDIDGNNGNTITGDRMKVKGNLSIKETKANGKIRLVGSIIEGVFRCNNSILDSNNKWALDCENIVVELDVFLRDSIFNSGISFIGAKIGKDFSCRGSTFNGNRSLTIGLNKVSVEDTLSLKGINEIKGILKLSNSSVGALSDDPKSWPAQKSLFIDGFKYGSFVGESTPCEAKTRKKWLALQDHTHFTPQPYQQLADVFRKMGRDRDARTIFLEKERMRQKHGNLHWLAILWGYFLDLTIGYGYRVGKAMGIVLMLIILGSFLFHWSYNGKLMQSVGEAKSGGINTEFNSVLYSIDVFVPFLDLHQEKFWLPDPTKPAKNTFLGYKRGWWARSYLWIHIILGWVFTTLLVATITGIIRRE
ncbi:MAG: hypothetical protein ACXACY_26160 [Candidatus Hodarchaeales archaeon]|jgi:hypothetical protein